MLPESKIPIASQPASKRFATWLALFYSSLFGMMGTHLPFFTVWLKAIGIDAFWIGIITAVPPVTRFTVLPLVTSLAERRRALRGAIIVTGFATALGFLILGTQQLPVLVFVAYAAICCLWTPILPLTDAYALRGVKHFGLSYGPLRLWGSAAFVAGAMICGLLVDVIAAKNLIWVIAGMATLSAFVSLGLQPLNISRTGATEQRGAERLAARYRVSRHHRHLGADPEQPLRLLHFRFHRLAAVGPWRADDRRPVGIGCDCRDRAVRVVAAVHAAAGGAGGDRGALRGRALGDNSARPSDCDSRGGSIGAWADLRTYPGRHHGTDGASRAGPCDGTRAGLSRGLQRHRRQHDIDRVGYRSTPSTGRASIT